MITLITNVGQLVSPSGRGAVFGGAMARVEALDRVQLVLKDGRIESIGSSLDVAKPDVTLDAAGRVVIPAFVDPHRHAGFPLVPGAASAGESDDSGSRPPSNLERNLRRGCRRAVADGVATLEVKCTQDGTASEATTCLGMTSQVASDGPIRLVRTLLLAATEERGTARDDRISDLIGRVIPTARRRRSATFCDVACGAGAYTVREADAILRAARSAGLAPKIHALGTETDEAALLAASIGATSVDHVQTLGARASRELRRAGAVCVLLPGRAALSGEACPDARKMVQAGLAVALGTDHGFAGRGLESMWMAFAWAIQRMGMSVEEALTACTLNAAAALGLGDVTGSAEVGKSADLAILDIERFSDVSGVFGVPPVVQTIVGGRPAAVS
jgi:imidazolonepropionase